jgi:membrane protein required for colicin V production
LLGCWNLEGGKSTLLDVLIILLVVGGVAFGFWKGMLLQGFIIVGVYVGALLGRFLYQPVAQGVIDLLHFNTMFTQIVVFLLIVALMPLLLIFTMRSLRGTLALPERMEQLDLLGGAVLGAVVGLEMAMLVVLAVGFFVSTADISNATQLHYPLLDEFRATWDRSVLRGPIVTVGQGFYYALLPNAGKTVPDILNVFKPR